MTWQPDGWNDDMREAPEDTDVLICANGEPITAYRAWDEPDGPVFFTGHCVIRGATNWRYLPSPPSKQED